MIFICRNLVYNFKSDSESFLSFTSGSSDLQLVRFDHWEHILTFDWLFLLIITWFILKVIHCVLIISHDTLFRSLSEIHRFLCQSLYHNLFIVFQFSFYKFRFDFMVMNLYELQIILKIHYVLLNVLVMW